MLRQSPRHGGVGSDRARATAERWSRCFGGRYGTVVCPPTVLKRQPRRRGAASTRNGRPEPTSDDPVEGWARQTGFMTDRPQHPEPSATDRGLEDAILTLLDHRAATSTICPSEAAKAVGGEEWRELMPASRAAAQRLVSAGLVDVTQGGEVVDVETARGPVRIRRRPAPTD
jgi:hypothetical protein